MEVTNTSIPRPVRSRLATSFPNQKKPISSKTKSCAKVIVEMRITHTLGVVIFADINATIGYCPYTEEGAVEYIFVIRSCRHRGYAKQLLKLVEKSVQCKLSFQMPVSTLGEKLRASHDQSARLNLDPGTPDSYMNPNSISE
jgi:hypothetical protein